MKLSLQQLNLHLKNHLLPVYLIAGNEPLLVQEAKELIHQKAKQQGFSEHQRYEITKDFNWNSLVESANSFSLFGDQSIIELRLHSKPIATASKVLTDFIENLSKDKILVILSEKLDGPTQKTSWFQKISNLGAVITIWPLDASSFHQWLRQRLQRHNIQANQHIIQFIADQTEGNPLAAAQEIEKLSLLYPNGMIPVDELVNIITDNARYDIFNFIDAILQGNYARIINIHNKLRTEGIEPTLLLWALTREIRNLINILQDIKNKNPWEVIIKKYHIWDKRIQLIKNIIQKHSLDNLHRLLLRSSHIDKIIKGAAQGNFWDETQILALNLGGKITTLE